MPFTSDDIQQTPLDIGTVPEAAPQRNPGILDIMGAGWRQMNTVGSLHGRESGAPFTFMTDHLDPNFDPFAHIPEDKKQFAGQYITANTLADVEAITRQIDKEQRDKQTLSDGGFLGVLSGIGAGVLDPINLVPVGGTAIEAARGGSILKGALTTAAVGLGATTLQEAGLQSTQLTRSLGESATNIAAGTFLSGLVGGVGTAWWKAIHPAGGGIDDLIQAVHSDLEVPPVGRYTRQEAVQALDIYDQSSARLSALKSQGVAHDSPDYIDAVLKHQEAQDRWEDIAPNVNQPDLLEPGGIEISADALKHDTGPDILFEESDGSMSMGMPRKSRTSPAPQGSRTAAELSDALVKDHKLIEKIPVISRQDPLIRTMLSNSLETRRVVQRLAESPLKYADNALGIAGKVPVESVIKQTRAPLAYALKHLDDMFIEYRTGRAAQAGDKLRLQVGDLAGSGEKLTYQQFKQEVGRAMRNGDVHSVREVQEAAQKFRSDVFDPLKEKAASLGLLPPDIDVKTAVSYLTRVWDIEKINQHYNEFYDVNLKWLRQKEAEKAPGDQRTPAQLQDIVTQLIERIRGTPDGRLRYHLLGDDPDAVDVFLNPPAGNLGRPKALHERVYDIPDAMVEDFLESDIEHVAKTYERSLAPDLALVEQFGSTSLEPEIRAIQREYGQKMRAAEPKQAAILKQKMDQDIGDLTAMRDRLRGTYALPRDPNSVFVRGGRILRSLNYLSLMGGVTISSIPDLGRPMMVHGLKRFLLDGLVPMVKNFKAFRMSAEETKMAGTALDMILDGRAMSIAEIMDDYGRGSKFERLLHNAASGFNEASGIAPWTATMKQLAGMMTQTRILQAVEEARAGRIKPKELENLAASFIDRKMAARIAEQFEAHGDTQGSVRLANTEHWTDSEAVKVFRAAIARDVDRTIVTPGQDKPLWLSTELGKIIGQFKSFAFASTQRVLLAGLQDRDLGVLHGLVFSTSLGVLATLIHSKLSSRPVSLRPVDLILEGVDRSGALGWVFDANNTVEKFTRGGIGISRLTGKQPMSRYASRNVTDALLGPSIGRVQDLARVSGAATQGEWRESDTRAIRRLLPFQNLFYLRGLFDAGEDGLQGILGVEDRTGEKTE